MTIQNITLLPLILSVSMLLTACGGGSGTENSATAPAAPAASTAAATPLAPVSPPLATSTPPTGSTSPSANTSTINPFAPVITPTTTAVPAATTTPVTTTTPAPPQPVAPAFGASLNVLVLGSSTSIDYATKGFSPVKIADELGKILRMDTSIGATVKVVAQDMYTSKSIVTAVGQGGTPNPVMHYRHSLAQYYYWPDGRDQRLSNLMGHDGTKWDFVVILEDPYLISKLPGYYALGANKIAAKVAEGGAQPLLLMEWPADTYSATDIKHFEEMTYRVGDGANHPLSVIPAGIAWNALTAKDSSISHPSPKGAYLAAAAIYSQITNRNATASSYVFDRTIADQVWSTKLAAQNATHFSGGSTFVSPFKSAGITDRALSYNQTGSSSEAGIAGGLQAVLSLGRAGLVAGGTPPIDFNYGRANTYFEAAKRYVVDPTKFKFSLGFPMQDDGSTGDTSMLYGLDRRDFSSYGASFDNGTDLGTAAYMIKANEMPYARAIPVRTLFAQMKEYQPGLSGYGDSWHMSADLNRSIGAYMYTLLTGHCALGTEPSPKGSAAWIDWMSQKVGYESAWTLTQMREKAPCLKVTPSSVTSVSVSPTTSAALSINFLNPPTADVTVTMTTDNDSAVTYSPKTLVFTAANYGTAQTVTLQGLPGNNGKAVTITASTQSSDKAFDKVADRWTYGITN